MTMPSRRALFAAPFLLLPLRGHAQGTAFVGDWSGDVPGIGACRMIITAVGRNGQVEGRMEFETRSFVSTFGDKADSGKNTNRGIVSGSTLIIDSALGGITSATQEAKALSREIGYVLNAADELRDLEKRS